MDFIVRDENFLYIDLDCREAPIYKMHIKYIYMYVCGLKMEYIFYFQKKIEPAYVNFQYIDA